MNAIEKCLAAMGWRTEQVVAPNGETLRVHFPKFRVELLKPALDYWVGALDGLEVVRVQWQRRKQTGVIQTGPLGDSGAMCYYKYLKLRDLQDWFKHWFRPSRALRTLYNELTLQAHGFRVAPPVLAIEGGRCGVYDRSALISEKVQAHSLAEWLAYFDGPEMPQAPPKRALINALAEAVGGLHRAGFYHGEMSLNNVMARLRGRQFEIIWIDNERTRQYRRLPFKRQIQNLNQLNRDQRLLGASERLRFLERYSREMDLSKSARRAIFNQVRRHSRRRGRVL